MVVHYQPALVISKVSKLLVAALYLTNTYSYHMREIVWLYLLGDDKLQRFSIPTRHIASVRFPDVILGLFSMSS